VGSPIAAGSGPVSLSVNSAGTKLYAANAGGNSVSAYSISAGTLTSLGAAVSTGTNTLPQGIAITP
jgi:DNA-binding beta-propeller fold protein YncE